jgi:microcystin-dependent protein
MSPVSIYPPTSAVATGIPPGCVMDYAAATPPAGWLVCDGSAQSRTTYAALFAAIGTTFGAGDGSTTFNLPQCQNKMTVGAGGTRALAASGGSADASGAPSHSHTGSSGVDSPDHAHASSITDGAGDHAHDARWSAPTGFSGTGASAMLRFATGANNTGNGGAHNHTVNNPGATARHAHSVTVDVAGIPWTDINMPPYIALNKIIKW